MFFLILKKLFILIAPTIAMLIWNNIIVKKLNKKPKPDTIAKDQVVEGKIIT